MSVSWPSIECDCDCDWVLALRDLIDSVSDCDSDDRWLSISSAKRNASSRLSSSLLVLVVVATTAVDDGAPVGLLFFALFAAMLSICFSRSSRVLLSSCWCCLTTSSDWCSNICDDCTSVTSLCNFVSDDAEDSSCSSHAAISEDCDKKAATCDSRSLVHCFRISSILRFLMRDAGSIVTAAGAVVVVVSDVDADEVVDAAAALDDVAAVDAAVPKLNAGAVDVVDALDVNDPLDVELLAPKSDIPEVDDEPKLKDVVVGTEAVVLVAPVATDGNEKDGAVEADDVIDAPVAGADPNANDGADAALDADVALFKSENPVLGVVDDAAPNENPDELAGAAVLPKLNDGAAADDAAVPKLKPVDGALEDVTPKLNPAVGADAEADADGANENPPPVDPNMLADDTRSMCVRVTCYLIIALTSP